MKIEPPDAKSVVSVVCFRLSIILLLFTFICISPAAAAVDSADRSVNQTEVAPGSTVVVTTTAGFNPPTGDARIEETISPALPAENIAITDSDGATISAYQESSGTVFSSWGNVSSVTLQYEITVPADTPGGTTFEFPAGQAVDAVDNDTATIAGDQTIRVPEKYANDGEPSASNTSDSTEEATNMTDESGDGATDETTDTSDSTGDTTNMSNESGDDTTDGVPGFGIGVAVSALALSGYFLKRYNSHR